jgi:uncharacterized membrane protein
MRRSILFVALALAACSPKAQTETPPTAQAKTVVSDFSKPMDARGTEPFWALTIRGTTLTLTRTGQPTLVATAPGAVIQPSQAAWTGKMADGRELKVTLYGSTCSDGMSDRRYPYSAEVDVPGEAPLSGCADTSAALAAPTKAAKP